MMRKLLPLLAALLVLFAFLAPASPALADGLIVVHNPPTVVPGHFSFAPLEVTYHKVDCTINDQVAVTSVDQEFYNPNGGRSLEGDYIFPIPANAQINKFAMEINGKLTEAELLPAEKARGIYEEIVRKSKDPALLEYAGRAMFKVRIFPIEAHSRKHVTLKYTELLKQDANLLDYHYTLNTEKFSSKPLKNVSLKVTVNTTSPITTLYSPTHEVEIKRHGETSAVVGFEAKDIRPDTDFHLYIGRKAAPVGLSVLTYKPDANAPGYFVLLAAPTLSKSVKAQPKDVVFVMDTSGSMNGAKIEQARKALKFCVNTLNPDDRFDIVRFSTEAEPFFKSLKPYNDENKRKALDFIDAMKATGGTAIQDALDAALAEREPHNGPAGSERIFLVVFLTDGQPTVGEQNPDKIIADAKTKGADVRIFSFGIGTDVNTKLLDQLAETTRGYSQYVLPNEDIEVAVSNFFGKVQDPILAGLKLDIANVTTSKLYPKALPDLFKGDQLVVFGTYDKGTKTSAVITGSVGGQEQKFAEDVVLADKTDATNEWIAKLWATRRVSYLLDEIRTRGESKELKDEVVELARRWGVVTPYTAMLIIEDERKQNIPVAFRSLREMEVDRSAVAASGQGVLANAAGAVHGDMAVNSSITGNAMKAASNTYATEALAAQTEARLRYQITTPGAAPADRPALAKDADNGKRLAEAGRVGGKSDLTLDLNGVAAAGPNAATGGTTTLQPTLTNAGQVQAGQLNLGNQAAANGWNYQARDAKEAQNATGYRIVGNYAAQNRLVNNRAFFLNGNQWTDTRAQQIVQEKKAKPVKIVFGSDAYFDLLKNHPEAAQYLSLGNNLTVEIAGTVYDIVDETPAPAAK